MAEQHISPRLAFRRLDEAVRAVRSGAGALSRAEAERRLWEELRVRGIMPAPPVVDRLVEDIMLGAGAAGRMRRSATRLGATAELAGFSIRLASAGLRHQRLPRWDSGGMRWVTPDPRVREQVVLDPAAGEVLAVGDDDAIEVWLEEARPEPGAQVPGTAAEQPIAVFRGQQRAGVLGPQASHAYRHAIREASEAGLTPVSLALRSQDNDGTWHLHLGPPAPGLLRASGG
jgi:hypothetical protein